jgi:hypothetical protein
MQNVSRYVSETTRISEIQTNFESYTEEKEENRGRKRRTYNHDIVDDFREGANEVWRHKFKVVCPKPRYVFIGYLVDKLDKENMVLQSLARA